MEHSKFNENDITFQELMWRGLPVIEPILSRELALRAKTNNKTGIDFLYSPKSWGAVLAWHITAKGMNIPEQEFVKLNRRIEKMHEALETENSNDS